MSSYPILITGANKVSNNQYKYTFPSSVDLSNYDIALADLSIYYSWYSISQAQGNNTFTINFPNGASNSTLNITIPDGTYSVNDLNSYLQYYFYSNGLYISNNTTGAITYYMSFVTNPTVYRIQLISYALPTSLPVGYTAGSGISFPTVSRQPQLVVNNSGFGSIIGFSNGTYPSTQTSSTYTQNGDLVPQVNPTQSVLMQCSVVHNPLALSNQTLHVFTCAGVNYGSLIVSSPAEYGWAPVGGTVNDLTITFTDQNYRPLNIVDTQLTIKLLLKPRDQK